MQQHLKWASLSAALTVATVVHAQTTFYVDDDAPPGGDGLSWYSAFNDMQDALDAMVTLRTNARILLADGVYFPDRGTGNRDAAFELAPVGDEGVVSAFSLSITGGYAGLGHPNPGWQDTAQFTSVLSGDLLGNDDATPASRNDNSRHVVRIINPQRSDIRMSWITIQSGNADSLDSDYGAGGGMYIEPSTHSARIEAMNLSILDCSAVNFGGGVYCGDANVSFQHCVFSQNRSDRGGSVGVSWFGSPTFYDCTFKTGQAAFGGAIAAWDCGEVTVWSSSFLENAATGRGGAIWADDDARVTVDACKFAGQIGSALSLSGGLSQITASTIVQTTNAPHAAVEVGTEARLVGNILWSNRSGDAPAQLWLADGAEVSVIDSCFESGLEAVLGDTSSLMWEHVIDADPRFVNELGPDGDPATVADNDYHLRFDSPCIDAAPSLGPTYHHELAGYWRPWNAHCSCKQIVDMGAYEYFGFDCPPPSERVYVDLAAPDAGDGMSWASAFNSLDRALATPGVTEIWMAEGLYFPPDHRAGFELSCSYRVRVLGGFAGNEDDESQRNPLAHRTIISADRQQDDGTGPYSRHDNDLRAFISDFGSVTLDGFIIEAFDDHGAAPDLYRESVIDLSVSELVLRNCTFESITAAKLVNTYGSGLTLDNCTFRDNTTQLVDSRGPSTLNDCRFLDNQASESNDLLRLQDSDIRNSRWVNNSATGSILRLDGSSSLLNAVFIQNVSTLSSIINAGGEGIIANCAFVHNSASALSAGHWYEYEVANNWLWSNSVTNTEFYRQMVHHCLSDTILSGDRNLLAEDPRVVQLPGPGRDHVWGTLDDDVGDLRPDDFSPLVDAGDSTVVPADLLLDPAEQPRRVDDPSVADTGWGFPMIDIGPFERQQASCIADWDFDNALTIHDVLLYLNAFNAQEPRADVNRDGIWGFFDLQIFLNAFAAGCP